MTTRPDSAPAPGRLGVWALATRPRTLGASIVPVLVGSALAAASGARRPGVTALCLAAAVLLQVGTNLANDALDFMRGIDTKERLGPVRVTQAGWLSARAVLAGAALCFGLAAACGALLVSVGGWPILAIGLASIAAGVGYSGGPYPLATHGLGEVAAFVFFGVVAVTGTAFLHSDTLSAEAVALSLPIGALVAGLMLVNNVRDLESDRAAGKRTLAVRLGDARARATYTALVGAAYVWLAPLALATGDGALLLPAASLPLALGLVRGLQRANDAADFGDALTGTARLHALFGLLLAGGVLL